MGFCSEDVEFEDGIITVTTEMEDFGGVQKKLFEFGETAR